MDAKDRMARAEDYVFGLMDERERERAERDMEVDAAFRECVVVLAERLRKLHRAKGATPMSDKDWDAITTHIESMPQMSRLSDSARLAAMGVPAADGGGKGHLRIKRPVAHQFSGWRGTVIACALAAALVMGYLAGQAAAPAPRPVAVALLGATQETPVALLEAYGNDSLRVLPLSDVTVPSGKVLQLWTWQNGQPLPLGTLSTLRETTLQGPDLPAPLPGQSYEITLEAAPGSTTGRPHGAVLFGGEAVIPPR